MSFILFMVLMYWLPTIIAIVRQVPSVLAIAMVNFLTGWTGVGWLAALIWALAAQTRPHVVIIENGRVVR
jgi:hypothetical protein